MTDDHGRAASAPMTDSTPRADPRPGRRSPSANGRPVRKDEIELHDRGVYIESWLPERRSRRKPLLFVHGELAGSWLWERYLALLRAPRLGGPRAQPPEPLLVADRRSGGALVRVLRRRRRRRPSIGWARPRSSIGHGMGGLLALKAAERHRPGGLVLLAPEPPDGAAAAGPAAIELREIPDVYGRAPDRLVDAAGEAPARPSRPDARRRAADPAPARPEAARERARASGAVLRGRSRRSAAVHRDAEARDRGRPRPARARADGRAGRDVARRRLRAVRGPLALTD